MLNSLGTRAAPFLFDTRQTSLDACLDHGALKLSEHAKHTKHGSA